MKTFLSIITFIFFITTAQCQNTASEKEVIDTVLVMWHKAAAEADFDKYYSLMTDSAVFLGTDATENWQIDQFKAYSKPHFDNGKAWSFTTLERNIYLDTENNTTAWFDEHLDTQMGICRGSGVVKKVKGVWKVQHYVLSIAVPNEHVSELTKMKKEWDSTQINKLRKKS